MRIKEGYILRTVAGENIVLPTGDNLDLSVMLTLNDTAKFLWEQLQEEKSIDDLVQAVLVSFEDVDATEVKCYIENFAAKLKEFDLLV